MKLTTALIATLAATPPLADGVPGLRGPDHVGFTVPDLGVAVSVFTDVMGCEAVHDLGLFSGSDSTWKQDHLNVDPKAEIPRISLVRCGNGANLEIFPYTAPDQRTPLPRNSDSGGHPIAFYVDDMAQAVDCLTSTGVKVLSKPTIMTESPSKGETWVYFLAPRGIQLELVNYSEGKPYEADLQNRLWDPRS